MEGSARLAKLDVTPLVSVLRVLVVNEFESYSYDARPPWMEGDRLVARARCKMCGWPAELTSLGTRLCPPCREKFREFHCRGCGEWVIHHVASIEPESGLAEALCSTCAFRNCLSELSKVDQEAILSAADRGLIEGIKEVRARLGWSLSDASMAIQRLRSSR